MKRIFTSALVLLLAIGSQAQTTSTEKVKGHKKEHRGNKEHKGGKDGHRRMEGKLNLTADQKTRLQTLRENLKKQSEELKNNTSLTKEQKQARRKELHQQFKTQSEAILTPAQREEAAKMRPVFKGKSKDAKWDRNRGNGKDSAITGRKWEGRGKGSGESFGKELNLTADQQSKMKQVKADYKSKLEALRNDKALSSEQKRARMQELKQAQQAQVKSILTKEQAEKMQSIRKDRPARNTK